VSKLRLTNKTRGLGQETRIAQYIRKLKKTTKLVFFSKKSVNDEIRKENKPKKY
jgi:hypothetical protein